MIAVGGLGKFRLIYDNRTHFWTIQEWSISASPFSQYAWKEVCAFPVREWAEEEINNIYQQQKRNSNND